MNRYSVRGLAACAAVTAVTASTTFTAAAAPVARIESRSATQHLLYGGGFAIAGKDDTVGSLTPVGLEAPATLQLAGGDAYAGSYLSWSVNWQMTWDLFQTWALDPTTGTLSGTGHEQLEQQSAVIGPGCELGCLASTLMQAKNNFALEFSLDAPTAFAFHSDASVDEAATLQRWNDVRLVWETVASGPINGGISDTTGTLDAGLFRVANWQFTQVLSIRPPTLQERWAFSLTLPDAQWEAAATPVPEPAPELLLPLALGLLAVQRQTQRRPELRNRAACRR